MKPAAPVDSLRATLLRWLLWPTLVVLPLGALHSYSEGAAIANAAYDRSLMLSARTMAETIRRADGRYTVELSYAALDMPEPDLGGRVFHRITGPDQRLLAGFEDLPPVPAGLPMSPAYPALVHLYDADYRGEPVRVAALHQPVSDPEASGMALVQVAETLEAREQMTRRLLMHTLARQLLLLVVAVGTILLAVRRGLAPLDSLRRDAQARSVDDLTPFDERTAPGEARAFVRALNRYIARLAELIALRKRFIENAAHQLRTPIAVLKTQLALAARERDPQALREIVQAMSGTADGAARLANQLLSLTRAEHGPAAPAQDIDMAALARQVCLDVAPRAVSEGFDLGFDESSAASAPLRGDPVLLHEMLANLLDNALKYAGAGECITVRVQALPGRLRLVVDDSGPGIPAHERAGALRRFHRPPGQTVPGSGLGLAIVEETATRHGGTVTLGESPYGGLRVAVELPSAGPTIPADPPAGGR
jgi:two-component system sensor histidine kinase TctE